MTETQKELALDAQRCGFVLVKEPRKPYQLKGPEGGVTGPFTAKELKIYLAGYSRGMYNHAPDCECGRLACVHKALKQ